MKPFDITNELKANTYPGRGIVLGRSEDGSRAVLIYFIMGRSVNSRNRVFVTTDDGIRTEAHDPALLSDPSLVIYHPVRFSDGYIVVTNGDQTDTIRDNLSADNSFHSALLKREFEPDAPNYTPRISGLVMPDGSYKLSILKSMNGDPACCCRYFYEYDAPVAGMGHFIHTYKSDGDPIPSFEGEPRTVAVTGTLSEYAGAVWDALDGDNKVALYAYSRDLNTGESESVIINKNS
ncbi:IMP cyclohydrolase [Sporobacter termitidis DSM 10068]|uniref:IMP cyclohydrolase n=1 Tax=Sporobacter termitidis DSM 10068 TaxID=1123282 RepID=A0A1M5X543_9FIRM|nr:IMP cyclohydrolase [Sporobacter termitidis]SHH94955.1 IMP cyclohydrolase [Sporobacter termitidis DSM 10068]